MLGNAAVGGEQGKLPISLIVFVKRLNDTTPGGMLAVVDLAEIQYRPLYDPAASTTLAFHNAPVTVLFAVFDPSCESQVHVARF